VRPTALLPLAFALTLAAYSQTSPDAKAAYTLGPDDQIMVRALHVPEIPDKPVRIEADGSIDLPLVGRIQAGGLTTWGLEGELSRTLKTYVREPEVSVELVEQRSQPVSVLGAVKTPGTYQLHGARTLLEALSLAGGADAEAGYLVRIARPVSQGALPVAGAKPDSAGAYTVAELSLEQVLNGRSSEGSLLVKPYDVITIPRAKMVYVIGEVKKPGGFVLHEAQHVSVLQAVAMAEGLSRTAGGKSARILRPASGSVDHEEIPVNLNDILSGKSKDAPLEAGDILYVPNSASKSAAVRTLEAAIQMATGLVIWRP
jgi:polysaccharide export outer membrane protein